MDSEVVGTTQGDVVMNEVSNENVGSSGSENKENTGNADGAEKLAETAPDTSNNNQTEQVSASETIQIPEGVLFLGNLPELVKEEQLRACFEPLGQILQTFIPLRSKIPLPEGTEVTYANQTETEEGETGNSEGQGDRPDTMGYAYLFYPTRKEAFEVRTKAMSLRTLDQIFKDTVIECPALPHLGVEYLFSKVLYVEKLPLDLRDAKYLRQRFAKYGDVLDCRIVFDRYTHNPSGNAYITFKYSHVAEQARLSLNKATFTAPPSGSPSKVTVTYAPPSSLVYDESVPSALVSTKKFLPPTEGAEHPDSQSGRLQRPNTPPPSSPTSATQSPYAATIQQYAAQSQPAQSPEAQAAQWAQYYQQLQAYQQQQQQQQQQYQAAMATPTVWPPTAASAAAAAAPPATPPAPTPDPSTQAWQQWQQYQQQWQQQYYQGFYGGGPQP